MMVPSDDCKRVRVKIMIKGVVENLYFIVGTDYIFPKFAYENRPENEGLRDRLCAACDNITVKMGGEYE